MICSLWGGEEPGLRDRLGRSRSREASQKLPSCPGER